MSAVTLGSGICAVWGPRDRTNMISVFYDIRDTVAPGDSYFADPGCLGSRDKLHGAVKEAGFSTFDIRSAAADCHFLGRRYSVSWACCAAGRLCSCTSCEQRPALKCTACLASRDANVAADERTSMTHAKLGART